MKKGLFKNPPNKFRLLQIIHGFENLLKNENGESVAYSDTEGPGIIERNLKKLKRMGAGGLVCNVSFKNYLRDEMAWKIFLEGVRIAEKLGFLLWLYDEEGYPSGVAGSLVLEGNPEYQSTGLARQEQEEGIKFEIVKTCDGTHATENVHAKRPYVNIMDKRAIRKFINLTHREYARRIPNLRKRIKAIFTDEPSLMTAYIRRGEQFTPVIPWVEDLPEIFKKKKGYSLQPHLEKLFLNAGDDCRKVRCDYYDVVAQLCAERYFGQIQKWCHKAGIAASGHNLCEENLVWHAFFYGDFYRQLRRYDLPGIDILSSNPGELINGNGFIAPKLVSSISHILGSGFTMSETSDHCQRCRGVQVSLREMIGTANLLYALGVNLITSYYGHFWRELKTKAFFSNSVNLSGSGKDYAHYCQYVGRLSYVLTGGRHVCSVAVYYPIWGVLANFYPTGRSIYEPHPDKTVQVISEEFTNICRALVRGQIDFDILDDRAIEDCRISDCRLKIKNERYEVVIIPPTDTIKLKTLKKIKKFAEAGGKVISVKMMPQFAAGMREDDAEVANLANEIFTRKGEYIVDSSILVEYLRKSGVNDLMLDSPNPDILYKHIYRDRRHIYFIANISSCPQEIDISFPLRGRPELWDPETGDIKKLKVHSVDARTGVELKFKSCEGKFVVFVR